MFEQIVSQGISRNPILGIKVSDPAGSLTETNSVFRTFVGYDADELSGMTVDELWPEEDREQGVAERRQLIAGERDYLNERRRYRTRAGRIVWGDTMVTAIRDAAGHCTALVAVVVDATNRHRQGILQRGQTRVLKQMYRGGSLEGISTAIIESVEEVEPGLLCSILRLDAATQTLHKVAAPNLPDFYNDAIDGMAIGPDVGSCGAAAYRKERIVVADLLHHQYWQKARRLVEKTDLRSCWSEPILAKNGEVLGTFAIYYTEPREPGPFELEMISAAAELAALAFSYNKARDALINSEKRFRQIVENAQEWIWETDSRGLYTFSNQAVETILGCKIDDVVGKQHFYDLFPPDEREKLKQSIFALFEKRQVMSGLIVRQVYGGGETVTLSVSGVPILDADGTLLGYRGAASDISKRLQLERDLRQSQKMDAIGTMAGGIAHDFNNLLAILCGHLDMIQYKNGATDANLAIVDKARTTIDRGKNLISQILTFSRQEKYEMVAVDLASVVEDAMKLLRPITPSTIKIMQKLDSGPHVVQAETTQLQQVLLNLCVNAVHAMDEKGILTVTLAEHTCNDKDTSLSPAVRRSGRYVRLSVGDTGVGIDKEIIDRIFDPFFTTKKVGKGTGMGLSVVHGIMEQHNGFVTVESDPGSGAVFHLHFPLYEKPATTAETGSIVQAVLKGSERILFVDDEECIVFSSGELLQDNGYRVTSTTSSVEALELFRNDPHAFDLVITDQTMPEVSGVELAKALLEIRPDIPIILCSGFSARVSEEEAKKIGIRRFCMKPLNIIQLATVTREVLDADGATG